MEYDRSCVWSQEAGSLQLEYFRSLLEQVVLVVEGVDEVIKILQLETQPLEIERTH